MPPERTSRGQAAKVHHVSGYRGCGLGVAVVVAAPCPCPPGYHQSPGSERKRAAVSQFHVSVCLTPTAPGPVRAALTAALAPFDMNRPKEGNPDGQWDRWYIDGGENRFAVKPTTRRRSPPHPPADLARWRVPRTAAAAMRRRAESAAGFRGDARTRDRRRPERAAGSGRRPGPGGCGAPGT